LGQAEPASASPAFHTHDGLSPSSVVSPTFPVPKHKPFANHFFVNVATCDAACSQTKVALAIVFERLQQARAAAKERI
jgi:hypothetical protein